MSGRQKLSANRFRLLTLEGVEGVVVLETVAQLAVDGDRFCDGAGEAPGIIAQRGFDFREHLRRAGFRVDTANFGFDLRICDFKVIKPGQQRFFVEIGLHQFFNFGSGQRLVEWPFRAEAMIVINALHRQAIRHKSIQVSRSRRAAGNRTDPERQKKAARAMRPRFPKT